MTTEAALYRLQSWLSPAYPVGAYTFSHGLEYAVERGWVTDKASTQGWLSDIVSLGNGFADLAFLAAGWERHGDDEALTELLELAWAFQATKELRLESVAQGAAFLRITQEAWPSDAGERLVRRESARLAYPVVVGVIAAAHGIDRRIAVAAYAHAFLANLVSAAVRLVPLGQTDGQKIVAGLEDVIARTVERACQTTPDHVGTATLRVDIASMNHEVQYTRLFRS